MEDKKKLTKRITSVPVGGRRKIGQIRGARCGPVLWPSL